MKGGKESKRKTEGYKETNTGKGTKERNETERDIDAEREKVIDSEKI